ncbi:hypothetical protein NDU88_002922 [Pleurodeles waltl]|uniref:Uncharacterized protein n=1 Tax=Pleurodeles waltl TaxID=8319 RepID=A0AAV7TLY2_PLEWA|nr:hypothetical protein NDU88_002922 [Pleurodeles waltl]
MTLEDDAWCASSGRRIRKERTRSGRTAQPRRATQKKTRAGRAAPSQRVTQEQDERRAVQRETGAFQPEKKLKGSTK